MTVPPPQGQPYPQPGPENFPGAQYPGAQYPPGYGFPVPNTGRRKKWWITAASLLGAAVACGAFGLWSMFGMLGAQPEQDAQFNNGGSVSVMFAEGETKYVYGQTESALHRMRCGSASPELSWDSLKADITINRWKALVAVTANKSGVYEIGCVGMDGDLFGVGEKVSSLPLLAMGVGGLAVLGSVVTFLVGAALK